MPQDLPPDPELPNHDLIDPAQPESLEGLGNKGAAEAEAIALDFPPDAEWLDTSEPDFSPFPKANKEMFAEVASEQSRSPVKAGAIKLLRSLNHTLERVIQQLEHEAPRRQLSRSPELTAVQQQVGDLATTAQQAAKEVSTELGDRIQPRWRRLREGWLSFLTLIRVWLPDAINEQIPDGVLTGAIAVILLVVVWGTSGLLATAPKVAEIAIRPTPTPTGLPQPSALPQPIPSPSMPVALPQPSPAPVVSPPIAAPTPESPTPTAPELTKPSPMAPAPVFSPSDPAPALPPLKRAPEQTLIARIQNDIAVVSDQYTSGLIQSVEANFRGSLLRVKVSESWYSLDRNQQDDLANELLNRATELDFIKLAIVDAKDHLLARSPVVGSEMVILKRNNVAEETV